MARIDQPTLDSQSHFTHVFEKLKMMCLSNLHSFILNRFLESKLPTVSRRIVINEVRLKFRSLWQGSCKLSVYTAAIINELAVRMLKVVHQLWLSSRNFHHSNSELWHCDRAFGNFLMDEAFGRTCAICGGLESSSVVFQSPQHRPI